MLTGIDQFNTFDSFDLHYWKNHVYYEGKEFPAGYFAAEILNFAGETRDPVLNRISSLPSLIDEAVLADKSRSRELIDTIYPLIKDAVSWIYTCPPFCYQEHQREWKNFEQAMNPEQFERQRNEDSEHLPFSFLLFCQNVLTILIAIYNFCLLTRVFEERYLRGLSQRTESELAQAAYKCFQEDLNFINILQHMPFQEIEEFFPKPRLILGFECIQDPSNPNKRMTVQCVTCKRLIDFYVFDLMNGLHHGHGPSWCHNCHRYFLTTSAHNPKYCDGVAPQNSRMTCRQYGAMMHQKEQNKNHPIYRTFTTRTNTIRKHHHRGKISDDLRKEALRVAEMYRDKALMDNDYAANDYEQDMEQEHVYAEAKKQLK